MQLNDGYKIINVADEYIAIPVGNESNYNDGLVVLNATTAYLLQSLEEPKTEEELVHLLTDEYDVEFDTAKRDVHRAISVMLEIGILKL